MDENSFMDGYHRGGEMTDRLIRAVHTVAYVFPNQRFGQVLVNAVRRTGLGTEGLFNLTDEDLIAALEAYVDRYTS